MRLLRQCKAVPIRAASWMAIRAAAIGLALHLAPTAVFGQTTVQTSVPAQPATQAPAPSAQLHRHQRCRCPTV